MLPNRFHFYCQHVLPLVYDESLSYYEVLCKLGEYIKTLTQDVGEMEGLISGLNVNLAQLRTEFNSFQKSTQNEFTTIKNQIQEDYNDLQQQINALQASLSPNQLDQIDAYIKANIETYVGDLVKYVMFGLDNTGHFVAYIPDTWQFIQFGSIEDIASPLYGHLTLQW